MTNYRVRPWLIHSYHALAHNIGLIARLAIFLFKLATLARLCWPYAAPVLVALPLAALATIDLVSHGGDLSRRLRVKGWMASAALLAAHFIALGLVARSGVQCPSGHGDVHPWNRP